MKIQHVLLSILLLQTAPAVVPWTPAQVEQPEALAARMKQKPGEPVIIQIGFETLYRSNHISKSDYAGPASTPQGLETLRKKLSTIPKDTDVVLYCGCCPFDKCPNVQPAFKLAKDMGFTKVKVLMIEKNLNDNWISKGFPTESQH
jgi:rhodanese-related sulfurtransferase